MIDWLLEGFADKGVSPGKRFEQLLKAEGILRMPGAHNAMAALLAKQAGFHALYVSGAAISASLGLADLGILTMQELCSAVRSIARATGLPVLVDGDTGYGEVINVMRLVRELEACGAAAVQIEDQEFPKKCGHLSGKRLISAHHMAEKIAAARRVRSHLRIVVRTDTAASGGIEETIRRARIYVEAGAEVIFPEALTSPEDFLRVSKALDVPLLANMTEFGKTPYLSAEEFEKLGYKIVIWPVSSLRIAAKAMEEFYRMLSKKGSAQPHLQRMQTRKELYEIIRYNDYEGLDKNIKRSRTP
jgi:methylisocitrate lyase